MQQLPPNLENIIQAELKPTEKIRWKASPRPGRMAKGTLPAVLFGIPWTAFALFWTAGAAGFKIPDFSQPVALFPLFGLPFILIGLGMLSSPYWAARNAASTAYAITNERAILFEAGTFKSMTIRSFFPDQLQSVRRVQMLDGSGDLILDQKVSHDGEGGKTSKDIGFFGIPNVKEVETIVLSLRKPQG